MQEKEKTTLNDFEDLHADTDFAEFEAFENAQNDVRDTAEKSDAEVSDKGQKNGSKRKGTKKADVSSETENYEDAHASDTDEIEAMPDEEMKELFVALPTDCTSDSFTISINLKSYEIKYGEPNLVPKHVYDYYHTMQKQKSDYLKVQRALRG